MWVLHILTLQSPSPASTLTPEYPCPPLPLVLSWVLESLPVCLLRMRCRGGSINKNRKLSLKKKKRSPIQADLPARVFFLKSPEMQSWRRFCRLNPGSAADL